MRTRCLLLAAAFSACALGADQPPQVSADVGPCTAEFTVTDVAQKPLYDAKIKTTVRYGFLNKRRVDLEVGTDAAGKARVTGLPREVKKPIEFAVRHQGVSKTLPYDPATDCHAAFRVTLESN